MFNLFPRRTAEDFINEAKETYTVPKVKPLTSSSNETYRVGATSDGMTTLTLMDSGGFSMTLTLNKQGCEQMIRMLRATYPDEEDRSNPVE